MPALSYCSVASPPDPVATVMAHESVRHGETVYSEAGVSNSAEGRCRDTGIQLAAAPPPSVPGIFMAMDCTNHVLAGAAAKNVTLLHSNQI